MKLNKPKNSNYCATVVKISTIVPLPNCDNVVHAVIMGNKVVVSKDTKVGDVGLFFPVETALSSSFLAKNNLYRNKELNDDKEKGGYFEENGRIRCVKFRKNSSEGLFMPIDSIFFLGSDIDVDLKEHDEFDELLGVEICKKYIPKNIKTPGSGGKTKKGKTLVESKVIDDQFRFHNDTNQLYKNVHNIEPNTLISITYKMHGTSGVSSNVLVKRPLSWWEKTLVKMGVKIETSVYGNLYSSRKVIKNPELRPNANHFYDVDVWGLANKQIEPFLTEGMTAYYEIVGTLPSGGEIQKNFDYGYPKDDKEFGIYIYRLTYTNVKGKVFEFSAKQVQDWCKGNGLNAVPQLFYGYASEFSDERLGEEKWQAKFLETIKEKYNDKDCYMCKNVVPEEGCVIRIEGGDAFKCKSERFYMYETKQLDKGNIDIESEN